MKNLTKGNPLKVILLFAIPLYIGQQFQLLYSLVDTRIIGGVLGENSLAAVGATTSLSDMLIEFLNGIICGFGIIVSTFYGAGEQKIYQSNYYRLDSNCTVGVEGAAIATVLSQAVSACICYLYMRKKYKEIVLHKKDIIPDKEVYRKLFPTGFSMGFMISFVTLGSLALQTSINTFGNNIIVAHTAARKITSMFMIPFFVLGTALATYCGQNLGAKEYARIKKGIKESIRFSIFCRQ